MQRISTFLLLLIALLPLNVSSQNLISSSLKGTKTKAQLQNIFGIPFAYDVKYYKVTYTTPDAKGVLDTASALIVVPSTTDKVYPRLVYQHGTSDCKTCVPSRYGTNSGGAEGEIGLLFAGMGYVSLLPDYVGMGDARGFQTYVHAATEASAALDLIRASEQWVANNNILINNQLFITGYSQGGHASMALHRAIELQFSNEYTVTAAAHLSGPYSISGVMRDKILSTSAYFYPAYVPNTILGYQEAYGNLYNSLSDVFKPAYVGFIQQYYNGTITLSNLNTKLIQSLITESGEPVARVMLKDSIVDVIENDLTHPMNVALQQNDVYKWTPTVPTRIFYCMNDDQVPFANSIIARDTMLALGCTTMVATDVKPSANHSGCVTPALTQTLLFFVTYQSVTTDANEAPLANTDMSIAPNPTLDHFLINGLPVRSAVRISDASGRLVHLITATDATLIDIDASQWPRGLYYVQGITPSGAVVNSRVVVGE